MTPLITKPYPRPVGEILALIQRIADLASNSANILESVEYSQRHHWEDSVLEFIEMLYDLRVLGFMLDAKYSLDDFKQFGEGEFYAFLNNEESRLDDYWDSMR